MKEGNYFSTILFALILLVLSNVLASSPEGISLIKISTGYLLDFTIPEYHVNSIYVEGEEYLQLNIKDIKPSGAPD